MQAEQPEQWKRAIIVKVAEKRENYVKSRANVP